jgi:hypothetical protein
VLVKGRGGTSLGNVAGYPIFPCQRDACANTQILPAKEVIYDMTKQLKLNLPIPEGYVLRFSSYITLKNGKRLYAKACGIRAFPIEVKA